MSRRIRLGQVGAAMSIGLLALTGLLTSLAGAAPGDLDPQFAKAGVKRGLEPEVAPAVTVRSDGSVVAAGSSPGAHGGDASVAAYTPAGRFDDSFAGDGTITIDLGAPSEVNEVAVTGGGDTVLAGQLRSGPGGADALLVRLRPDGTLDSSFAGDGSVAVDLGGFDRLDGLALSPDGRILAVGTGLDASRNGFAVIRLLSNGSLDDSFSGDGVEIYPGTAATALALRADGRILVAGGTTPSGGLGQVEVIQLRPDGSLDESFGANGILILDLPGLDNGASSIALDAAGMTYVNARACDTLDRACSYALLRLTSNGRLDSSFGRDGLVDPVVGPGLAIDAAGRPLVAGTAALKRRFEFTLGVSRLDTAGKPDRSFSGDGTAFAYSGSAAAEGQDLALAPDGSIVGSGFIPGSFGRHLVARFLVAKGPRDADADGFRDKQDRCDLLRAKRHSGCPSIRRSLSLDRVGPNRLKGRLESDERRCVTKNRIGILRNERGSGDKVARAIVHRSGNWRIRRPLAPGRYRAQASGHFADALGYCRRVLTQTVLIP